MIRENISLLNYNTFKLDYRADRLVEIDTEEGITEMIRQNEKSIILGGGSNLLFINDFHGTILHPVMGGISVEEESDNEATVSAGAGTNWDYFVEWCTVNGYYGLENLSNIPGSVGAAPIQNIGAYGSEAKEFICKVRAVSLESGEIREFRAEECGFGYRNSIFKTKLRGKYLVTRVYFSIKTFFEQKNDYGRLFNHIKTQGKRGPDDLRNAVISIRKEKLPDPAITGNAGSFFKNPVINTQKAQRIIEENPLIPNYPEPDNKIKLSAAWLIDQCGLKGKRIGDAGVHERQPLVLVNYGKATGPDIFNLSEEIRSSVKEKFGIDLEREVIVVS